jgi:hypothetical protein
MHFVRFALLLLVASTVIAVAEAQSSAADEAKTLTQLEQNLRVLHSKLASASASELGLTGARAALFNEARAENANYVRTVVAAIQMIRENPDLLNSYHAAVGLTGLQYDLNGLLLAARMSGSEKASRWSSSLQMLVDSVNKLGDVAYSKIEGRVLNAQLALRKPQP